MSVLVRANADWSDGGGNNRIGAASNGVALGDAWDGSYVLVNSFVEVQLGDISIAGNQRILGPKMYVRVRSFNAAFNANTAIDFTDGSGGYSSAITWSWPYSGFTDYRTPGIYTSAPSTGGEWTLAQANAARFRIRQLPGATTSAEFAEVGLDWEIRTQPTVGSVSATPGTRTPTIAWAFGDPDGLQGQFGYQVKIFTAPQGDPENAGGWVYNSGVVGGGNTNHTITSSLADDTYYVYVKVSKDFRGGHWFSGWAPGGFTIDDTPEQPTVLNPPTGSTITTSKPTVGATVNPSGLSTPARLHFQIDTNPAFPASRDFTEAIGDARVSGGSVEPWPATIARLQQGTWHFRARAIDVTGKAGSWTGAQTFVVSHPPSPANQTPTGNTTLNYGASGTTIFDWDFTDPAPEGDTQTAFQVEISRNDTAAIVHDSGKITGAPGAITQYSYNVPVGQKDQPLRWRVRLYDQDDVVGAWSGYQLFRVSDQPQIVIGYPADNSLIDQARPNITWVTTLSGGRTQASYRVRINKVGAALGSTYDYSGSGTDQSHQPPSNVLDNLNDYDIRVDVTDSTALTNFDSNRVTVAFDAPRPINFTLNADSYNQQGYVLISFDDTVRDAQWTQYSIYRRPADGDWELVETITTPAADYQVKDWLVASGAIHEYAVTQYALRFGIPIESPKPGQNRTASYGFESGMVGWQFTGIGGTGTRLTTGGAGGSTACIDLNDTSGSDYIRLVQSAVDDIPVTPGEVIRVEVDLNVLDLNAAPTVAFVFSDAADTQEIQFPNPSFVVGTWTSKSFQFQVPIGKTAGYVRVMPTSSTDVTKLGRVQVDNINVYSVSRYVSTEHADYWLIHPTNEALNVRLHHVTTDSFTEEYEQEVMVLIGRGRKRDVGTRLGYEGQLTAQLWDEADATAREQRLALQALNASRDAIYLRSPFGDVWQVAAGGIQFSRRAGVGARDFGTVTISYTELS